MMRIFLVRPATRNIGNDVIAYATSELLRQVLGVGTTLVNVPALRGARMGGLVAQQIYEMNRLADGVVVGGGNLLENGELHYDARAVEALRRPLVVLGLSHGRIAGRDGGLEHRSDSLAAESIRHLVASSAAALVRDEASRDLLRELGAEVEVGGCPSLFLPPDPRAGDPEGDILISIRHPLRMCVPPVLQWRIAEDLRRLIAVLRAEFHRPVGLVCHDYIDLEFAAGFPEAQALYFDEVPPFLAALRGCALHVSYRLHGFLPCLALGTPSIHLAYDERGSSMLRTVGMGAWDINLLEEPDCIAAVLDRARSLDRFCALRAAVAPRIEALRRTSVRGLERLGAPSLQPVSCR